jgi:hypothetical protein
MSSQSARVHNLTQVTRNIVDLANTGMELTNPWAA